MSVPFALHPLEAENTTELPVLPLKKLSKGAIAGICILCIVVVLGLIAVTLYFTVFQKRNKGKSKFGVLTVQNQNGVASSTYTPGATVKAVYTPTNAGFGGEAIWNLSVGGKLTAIQTAKGVNSITYTLPINAFNAQCFIQVVDTEMTQDYVNSPYFSIIPVLSDTDGPGVSAGNIIQNNTLIALTFTSDAPLPANTVWALQFSSDGSNFSSSVVPSQVTNQNNLRFKLTATPDLASSSKPYYWRVSTTNLKAQGYPEELELLSPFPIGVQGVTPPPSPSPSPSPPKPIPTPTPTPTPSPSPTPGTPTLTLQSSNGSTNQFAPGSTMTLVLTNLALGANPIWQYSVNQGATYTSFVPSVVGNSDPTITWVIPNNLFAPNNAFQVWLQVGSVNVMSNNAFVICTMTWDYPRTGSTINVWPLGPPTSQTLITNVTVNGYFTEYTQWTVTIAPETGNAVTKNCVISEVVGQVITLSWTFNSADISLSVATPALITFIASIPNVGNVFSRTTTGPVTLLPSLPTYTFGLLPTMVGGTSSYLAIDTTSNRSPIPTNCDGVCYSGSYLPATVANIAYLAPESTGTNFFFIGDGSANPYVNLYIWTGINNYPVMANYSVFISQGVTFYRPFFISQGESISTILPAGSFQLLLQSGTTYALYQSGVPIASDYDSTTATYYLTENRSSALLIDFTVTPGMINSG